jgi:hypothetical protein
MSDYAVVATALISVVISVVFKWTYDNSINFMGGDAKDYYSYLVSVFIDHNLSSQTVGEWYLLKTSSGVVNVHPIGVSVLLLPFFFVAMAFAAFFGYDLNGYSFPFQVSVATAALLYALLGLVFLRKLFQVNNISDRVSALMIALVFFGTNLLNYTLSEGGMSHVYSFALISVFLYHSCKFVQERKNHNLFSAAAVFGLILLVRPNNVLVLLSFPMWFKSGKELFIFFKRFFRSKSFYAAAAIVLLIAFIQSLVWFIQTGNLFVDTYKRDGFYWLCPAVRGMLFGFDGGLFIYTPICFLFLFGLIPLYKESKFGSFMAGGFLFILIYFFSSYWAYNYFDGLGIRVLIDYYAIFALLGAKLFEAVSLRDMGFYPVLLAALLLVTINLIYCYQANRNILARAGMTFDKWQYVFLRTDKKYQNCLGGSNEIAPFAKITPRPIFLRSLTLGDPVNYSGQEYGPAISIDGLGIASNRISVKLDCTRKEFYANSSGRAQLCMSVVDPKTKVNKTYVQFPLNETPSDCCCQGKEYHYRANLVGDFDADDRLSIYLWNIDKQPFLLEKLSAEVYNYNYNLN